MTRLKLWAAAVVAAVVAVLVALARAKRQGKAEAEQAQERANAAEYHRARTAADTAARAGGDPIERLRKHEGALRD